MSKKRKPAEPVSIFGYTFESIQAMQRKQATRPVVAGPKVTKPVKP